MKKLLLFPLVSIVFFSCVQEQQPVNTGVYKLQSDVELLKTKTNLNSKKIASLDSRLSNVEDKTAGNEQQIFDLKKQVQAMEQTLSSITVPSPAVGNETESQEQSQPVVQVSDKDLYKQAFSAMESGDLETAKSLFAKLVEQYPDSSLADNALYWIGEIYYSHNDYQTAANYFNQVIEKYPDGNKVPAAMLKLALCYKGMDKVDKAKQVLQQVISKYPNTPEAAIAKAKLIELEQ